MAQNPAISAPSFADFPSELLALLFEADSSHCALLLYKCGNAALCAKIIQGGCLHMDLCDMKGFSKSVWPALLSSLRLESLKIVRNARIGSIQHLNACLLQLSSSLQTLELDLVETGEMCTTMRMTAGKTGATYGMVNFGERFPNLTRLTLKSTREIGSHWSSEDFALLPPNLEYLCLENVACRADADWTRTDLLPKPLKTLRLRWSKGTPIWAVSSFQNLPPSITDFDCIPKVDSREELFAHLPTSITKLTEPYSNDALCRRHPMRLASLFLRNRSHPDESIPYSPTLTSIISSMNVYIDQTFMKQFPRHLLRLDLRGPIPWESIQEGDLPPNLISFGDNVPVEYFHLLPRSLTWLRSRILGDSEVTTLKGLPDGLLFLNLHFSPRSPVTAEAVAELPRSLTRLRVNGPEGKIFKAFLHNLPTSVTHLEIQALLPTVGDAFIHAFPEPFALTSLTILGAHRMGSATFFESLPRGLRDLSIHTESLIIFPRHIIGLPPGLTRLHLSATSSTEMNGFAVGLPRSLTYLQLSRDLNLEDEILADFPRKLRHLQCGTLNIHNLELLRDLPPSLRTFTCKLIVRDYKPKWEDERSYLPESLTDVTLGEQGKELWHHRLVVNNTLSARYGPLALPLSFNPSNNA